MNRHPVLQNLVENLTKEVYNTDLNESINEGLCVSCKEPALPKCYSKAGFKEFSISGLCEECFDKIFEGDE